MSSKRMGAGEAETRMASAAILAWASLACVGGAYLLSSSSSTWLRLVELSWVRRWLSLRERPNRDVVSKPVEPRQAYVVLALAACAVAIATSIFTVPGFALSIWIVAVGPGWIGRVRAARHAREFERQLPDAMQALAAGLGAGQALPQALAGLASGMPSPCGAFFAAVDRRVQLGERVDVALRSTRAPADVAAWRGFVSAVESLTRSGGGLSQVAARTASVMRRRARVLQRLDTLTAQGRAQAWIVAALPPVLLLVLRALEPALFEVLTETFAGWCLLTLAAALDLGALWLMRRILDLDV